MKRSKNCILKNNCKFTSSDEEYIEIGDDILVLNNVRDRTFNSSCDERKYRLKGNYFIHFQNCTVKVDNKSYNNRVSKFVNKFIIPNNVTIKFNSTDLTFEELIIKQEENIKEIKELQYQKYVNIGLGSLSILLILSFIPMILGNRKLKIKLINRIQENPYTNRGGVTCSNITKHNEDEMDHKGEDVPCDPVKDLLHSIRVRVE